ncbi:DinB family protein [Chryseomicrobium sp. FSL W7-1435]|uniref:DinB family protein n=1 Tax=Chryseomicrobium sp. FSL W7-1435 TaxID=2921704 RepID=UPI00315B2216
MANTMNLIKTYISKVQNYPNEQLCFNPSTSEWSITQVYDHCIVVAHEYCDAAEECIAGNGELQTRKSKFGEELFERGGFPPIKITLPAEMNQAPDNSQTKEELVVRLENLNERMEVLKEKIEIDHPHLSVRHGGFGWLNASEWLALVDMHFNHHLRQLKTLESQWRNQS